MFSRGISAGKFLADSGTLDRVPGDAMASSRGFWPARKYPDKWVVLTVFRNDLFPWGGGPDVFGEKPFNDESSARTYAQDLKIGKGYKVVKVEPPVS